MRVEVLRGPQGTLFGKNTIAGAINIVTRQPSEKLRAEVALSGGDFGKRRGEVYLNGPLVEDKLFGKISAFHNERDGYFENRTTGQRLWQRRHHRWSGSAALHTHGTARTDTERRTTRIKRRATTRTNW